MEKPMPHSALEALLNQLGGQTLSFPHAVAELNVLQTHISIVLLAGEFAYKIKKPIQLPFVDYSTLEKRHFFCRMEVDLNRRLAGEVYLGVVPITRRGNQLEMEGTGEPVEYAVKMRRLPEDRRLGNLLKSGGIPENFWAKLAYCLTLFYRNAARGPEVAKWALPDAVEQDWHQLLDQIRAFPPEILDPSIGGRLEDLALLAPQAQRARISKRAPAARDGHGDLRLEHIYYFPGEPEDRELVIIDCVEFNPRYRCADPLCDIAFLVADLEAAGFPGQSALFRREYLKASGDPSDHLLDFYVAYRHLVRGLVRGLQGLDREASLEERSQASDKARVHFLQALSRLEDPGRRPCLLLLGGLPGSGKSTLSEQLASAEGFRVFSSDAMRKELAGKPYSSQSPTTFEKGIYSPEWTEKTYSSLLQRAGETLRLGGRVLVDASFSREKWREAFLRLARDLRLPFVFFVCTVGHETIQKRLAGARHFGSEADWDIYRKMAGHWETPAPDLGALFLNTEHPLAANLAEIHRTLDQVGLVNPETTGTVLKK